MSSPRRISRPGEYEGYSQPIYDGWVRSSQYMEVRDGTRLAVDIIRPTKDGVIEEQPLPVIWMHCRYHRSDLTPEGEIVPIETWDLVLPLVTHGYVAVAVDTRGCGASFGTSHGWYSPEEQRDSYDITEWLAAQPWSDGNIGMYGRSYSGITQYFCAAQKPPHLRAIFPEMAWFDGYDFIYPGGIYRDDFVNMWGAAVRCLDLGIGVVAPGGLTLHTVAPVDEDQDGSSLRAAQKEHGQNRDISTMFAGLPYRNSVDHISGSQVHLERSLAYYLRQIEESGVAIYHYAGWYDCFTRDAFLYYTNLGNPQKLTVTPFFHVEYMDEVFNLAQEQLRWFDYWLKGIDNGIMDEPAIHYWRLGGPGGEKWRTADQWPLPDEQRRRFFFHAGRSGSIESTNDGILSAGKPEKDKGRDDYLVDYRATSGEANRWANAYSGLGRMIPFEEGEDWGYPNLATNDAKGLTYTTAPLEEDLEVTGHPVVHLWVRSTAKDGDFFVFLEEVLPNGHSKYVSDGSLRASHRRINDPPYNYLEMPWHRSYAEDSEPLPDEPVELAFDLQPTSKVFAAGNRIRVTITCSDWDNCLTPQLDPPPKVSLYRDVIHASHISLPIIPIG